jgi:hypothetical protein
LVEREYEDKIITILKNYSPLVTDGMKDVFTLNETGIKDTILAEHGILTYSQTLQLKGGIIYNVGAGDIDTSKCKYGTIINAQSISNAKLISLKNIKHIVTIENQENYEKLYNNAKGCAISDEKRKLLEKIDAKELTDLKECILKYGVEFEQETQMS